MMFSQHICSFVQKIEAFPKPHLGTWYALFGFMPFLFERKGVVLAEMMALVWKRGPVVVVGPIYLDRLHRVFRHVGFVRVPNKRACNDRVDTWDARARIKREIRKLSARFPRSGVQFLAAGGMAMKLIILEMAQELGHKDSFFDIGSTFDGFAGYASRDYNDPETM